MSRVDLRNHCGHGKPTSEPCIVCEKMDKIQMSKIREYEGIIAYVAEWQFLGREKEIEGSEIVTLLAVIYQKDELRIIHDIKKYLEKRK